jgi:predicted site-specific integrase-resolvase
MRLPEYAEKMGVAQLTARRWFHAGQIPGAYQLPTGTIIVPDPEPPTKKETKGLNIIYARVSNNSRRHTDLEYQAQRLVEYAMANGYTIDRVIKEVGSGLNDKRKQLDSLLRSDANIKRIIIEHRDRLTRFGMNYLEILAEKQGFEKSSLKSKDLK